MSLYSLLMSLFWVFTGFVWGTMFTFWWIQETRNGEKWRREIYEKEEKQ